ncbi:TPA: beta strand repeat-containing protein [Salmonella enterica subsp. enterica serovar Paratyphi B]
MTLQLDNTGLASVSVNGSVVNALVENSGLIAATNGQVYLTARGKEMLLNTVVNNSGTVEARGLNHRGGEIVLDGGESGVVSQSGMLLADSETGRGGKITVQGKNIHLAAGSRTSATGRTGGGGVYVGGGWQGKDAAIRNASKVVMDRDAVIDVSATEKGDGGKAVLWSEDYTNFRGRILAKGGAQSGNGGQVETSSHHNLQAFGDVDASALNGRGGNWLLDPLDVTIVSGSSNTNVTETGKGTEPKLDSDTDHVFSPSAAGAKVSAVKIADQLNNGTSVTVDTHGTGTQGGNITVNADISKTKGGDATLTLNADNSINITNHTISSTADKLDVNLYAAGSADGTLTLNHATVSTNGGNIALGMKPATTGTSVSTGVVLNISNHTALNAAAASAPSALTNGNITLMANKGATLSSVNLTGNNITITASSSTADALSISGQSKLNADTNLTVSGVSSAGVKKDMHFYGIHTWGGVLFAAGDTVTLSAAATDGTDGAFNASNINVSAQNAVITGTAGAVNGTGIKINGGISNTLSNGNLTLNGTATGGNGTGVLLQSASVKANGSGLLTVTGKTQTGLGVTINNGTLSGGNVTVNGTLSDGVGKGVWVYGASKLTATSGDLNLTGAQTNGDSGYGIHIHGDNTLTASNNITLTASAKNGKDGALNADTNTFSAINTVLNGTSNQNNIGVKLGGNTRIQGNLSVTGTTRQIGGGSWTALITQNLNLTVSCGSLNMKGVVTGTPNGTQPVALNLTNAILSASSATLTGVNTDHNNGFVLNNVTLKGGIANGANLTLSSAGSNKNVTNVIGSGILNVTTTEALMKQGIDNSTQIDTTGMTLGGSGADWVDSYTSKRGVWILKNVTVNKAGNISLQGVSFADSNITAGQDLTIDNVMRSLTVQSSNLTAKAGKISLTANGGINLSGSNMTANKDISLNASRGGVSITGKNNSTGIAKITSTAGNISISGNATGQQASGVSLTNTALTSPSGNINVSGVGDRGSYSMYYLNGGGVTLSGKTSFTSRHNILNGKNIAEKYQEQLFGIGLLGSADIIFTGDTDINAHSERGAGFLLNNGGDDEKLTFLHGKATINATSNYDGSDDSKLDSVGGGMVLSGVEWESRTFDINVSDGASLNINAQTNAGNGIASFGFRKDGVDSIIRRSGFRFTGDGDVNIHSVSDSGDGLDLRVVDNTGLTGNFTVTGESKSGTGVSVPEFATVNVVNATVTGTSQDGTGIRVNSGDTKHKPQVNLNGNNLTGISDTSTGINITGNNVTITNGTLNGTSSGNSAGVQLTGGSNYTVDGATVTGHSVAGHGVGVGGNLSVSNGTLSGSTVTGSGVDITGGLSSSNTTITGDASGSGSGVTLGGKIAGDDADKNVITGNSARGDGVVITGNPVVDNITLHGNAVDGNGIKVTGSLTVNNTVATGNATGNGNGIMLAGCVTGGNWSGHSADGTGVHVDGDSMLTDVTVSGSTITGTGVDVSGSLTNAGSTTVKGEATGSGTGASVGGTLNGSIDSTSVSGSGAVVNGTVNGTVKGTSASGSGTVVGDGANITQGSQVNGLSGSGAGLSVEGNVTNGGSITGTTNGTGDGVSLTGDVSGGAVSGNAPDGTGVNITGDTTLSDVSVTGTTATGTGVGVNGHLTNTGSTVVNGTAASGSGIYLDDHVTGGLLNGVSVSGPGIYLDKEVILSGTTLNGNSDSNSGLVVNGTVINTDSVLHGQSGSGDGVSLNGAVTGGNLHGTSGSGAGIHVTGNSSVRGVNVSASGVQLDGVLSTSDGTTLNGVVQRDSSAERRQVYELQNRLSHNNRSLKQVVTASGYREQEKPVVVDICTDGESSCRHLDAGTPDRPLHP